MARIKGGLNAKKKHNRVLKLAKDLEERTALISYCKDNGVMLVFHYVPFGEETVIRGIKRLKH